MRKTLACLFGLLFAAPLGAHPHVFIDTGLELSFDSAGQLESVRVTWVYDEFYSLLITEDMGLDPDYDGILTEAEQAELTGFDMQWVEGFNGDLEIFQKGDLLDLSGPQKISASYQDGRITTVHTRQVMSPTVVGQPLELMPYDLSYYTAYDVTLPVVLKGQAACRHRLEVPDLNEGLIELRAKLQMLDAEMTPEEEGLPNIGAELATRVIVTCPVS
ncbi:MAG: DUF1007 family protein [Sulfitobacter sp.]|nr:DUF1007 family protein [Sulfitobacter sp.]